MCDAYVYVVSVHIMKEMMYVFMKETEILFPGFCYIFYFLRVSLQCNSFTSKKFRTFFVDYIHTWKLQEQI